MANETNKTEEILVFKVDQGSAVTDLEKLRKSMVGLKEEQRQLNDAYKKGDITVEEYAREITRVDTLLKKVSTSHNQAQKALAGVQTETSKLIKSNRDLAKTLKDSANDINVAGVGLGTLTSRLQSLLNPITASVAIVGALGAAYARSTIGARDLAFAQNQLSSALTQVTNDFASLISSAEDGEGALTKVQNILFQNAGNIGSVFGGPIGELFGKYLEGVGKISKEAAMAQEKLEDLAREELKVRSEISDRLADNQETLTFINDQSTKYEDKLASISNIIGNLRTNEKDMLYIKEQQLAAIESQLKGDETNETLLTAQAEINREISKIKADTEKKVQAILRLEDNITTANDKQLQTEKEKTAELKRQQEERLKNQQISLGRLASNETPTQQLQREVDESVKIQKDGNAEIAKSSAALADRIEDSNKKVAKSNETVADSTDAQRDALRLFSSEAARLYQTINSDNKYFAAAQLAVDAGLTLSGIERASARITAESGPRAGAIYRAAAYLSAGASLAKASKLIGTSSPGIDSLGPTLTSSSGDQYVIQNGKAVPLDKAQRKADRGESIATIGSSTLSGAATGAAIGSFIPGVGTAIGAGVGAVVGLVAGIIKNKKRRKALGYASGGWTGPGEANDVAGLVHADEYVAPKRVVNTPAAQPHLKALEQMRLRGYQSGGYVSPSASNDYRLLAEALANLQVIATIQDINIAKNRYATKMSIVTK